MVATCKASVCVFAFLIAVTDSFNDVPRLLPCLVAFFCAVFRADMAVAESTPPFSNWPRRSMES